MTELTTFCPHNSQGNASSKVCISKIVYCLHPRTNLMMVRSHFLENPSIKQRNQHESLTTNSLMTDFCNCRCENSCIWYFCIYNSVVIKVAETSVNTNNSPSQDYTTLQTRTITQTTTFLHFLHRFSDIRWVWTFLVVVYIYFGFQTTIQLILIESVCILF